MAAAADLSRLLGVGVERVEPVVGGGYTAAERLRLHLADGTTAFAKVATEPLSAEAIGQEIAALRVLGPQPFLPRLLAAGDGVLVLEDLGHARWPPPWATGDVDRVLATMAEVAATRVPGLPTIEEHRPWVLRQWRGVEVDPLVGLGVDRGWLARALPVLRAIDDAAAFDGDDLLHMDLRSDNLCLLPDRVVVVDWNGACRGPGDLDLVCWAPSLALEGGPHPWELLPDADVAHVSLIAGYFAQRSPLPPIPGLPRVRPFQQAQLRVALPWVARVLDLGEPFRR